MLFYNSCPKPRGGNWESTLPKNGSFIIPLCLRRFGLSCTGANVKAWLQEIEFVRDLEGYLIGPWVAMGH